MPAGPRSVWEIVSGPGVLEGLKRHAARRRRDWPFATWSATSVTHEALLVMHGQEGVPSEPGEFLAAFRTHLQRTLIEKYRRKKAKRRGGGFRRVLARLGQVFSRPARREIDPDVAALVDEYVRNKPLLAVIAWMTSELGLTEEEMVPLLGIDVESVRRKLRRVRAELRSELDPR